MANKLKSPKITHDSDVFSEEKVDEVEFKELVKDKRTHKILGAVFLFICLFLFLAKPIVAVAIARNNPFTLEPPFFFSAPY